MLRFLLFIFLANYLVSFSTNIEANDCLKNSTRIIFNTRKELQNRLKAFFTQKKYTVTRLRDMLRGTDFSLNLHDYGLSFYVRHILKNDYFPILDTDSIDEKNRKIIKNIMLTRLNEVSRILNQITTSLTFWSTKEKENLINILYPRGKPIDYSRTYFEPWKTYSNKMNIDVIDSLVNDFVTEVKTQKLLVKNGLYARSFKRGPIDDLPFGIGIFPLFFSFSPGDVLYSFKNSTFVKYVDRYTVQISEKEHVIDPILSWINHSNDPNVFIDTVKMEVRAIKEIGPSDLITFFYPSTEWSMRESFNVANEENVLLKNITGAADLNEISLSRFEINEHILRLKKAQRVED